MLEVAVIGAGIIGLTTAQLLTEFFPSTKITVIADRFSPNTTSDGAAGIFRPSPSFSGVDFQTTKIWINDSYNLWEEYRTQKWADEFKGIVPISGYIFSKIDYDLTKNHFLEKLVPTYRPATQDELNTYGYSNKFGSFFETLLIDSKTFLNWVLNRLNLRNVNVMKRSLKSFDELGEFNFDIIFNCTGLGSQKLCNDHKLLPIRGQVYKVQAPWIKNFVYADYDTYVIPGLNGLVTLGGCRQYESYDLEWNEFDGASIMNRCTKLVPDVAKALIIDKWTGLRPHRETVRVEIEKINVTNGKQLNIIHNYGHGGYGITTAPGTVKYSIELLHELLRAKL